MNRPLEAPGGDRPPAWSAFFSRRDFLRVGSLGIAATLAPGSPSRASGSEVQAPDGRTGTCRSVIVLWLAGGVTQLESFDPKPEAPEAVRGTLRAIETRLPGVRFSETLPCLAGVADRLAVLRSYSHGDNDHFVAQAYALSGRKVGRDQITTEPNVGSVVACLRGARAGLPGYVAVPGTTRPGPPPTNLFVGGWLGRQYDPFASGGEGVDFTRGKKSDNPPAEFAEDLQPPVLALPDGVDTERFGGRVRLRERLDQALLAADRRRTTAVLDGQYQDAFRLITAPQIRAAFDVSREPDRTRDGYGRTKIGQRCLLARRLVEAGARFVLVDYGYDPDYGNLWDNHCAPGQRQPHISEMSKRGYHLAGVDRAFAALITDLESRGLLGSTLVVFLTEFGRTPQINPQGGRDHWAPAGSLFFAGGGTRGGQVIGATDKHAAHPTTRGYTPSDVAATIYRAIGVDPGGLLYDLQQRPHLVLNEGEAIPEVF
jgi:hypothetical protein